jgi:hypothetical protein
LAKEKPQTYCQPEKIKTLNSWGIAIPLNFPNHYNFTEKIMKQLLFFVGIAIGLIATNPNRAAYETYAIEQIADLAKAQCNQTPSEFGTLLQGSCRNAIELLKPQLRSPIAANTQRQNWYFISFYRSDVSIPEANANIHLETIGILNNFYTYKSP